MKTILSASLALGLCGLAYAQDPKADPVGRVPLERAHGPLNLRGDPPALLVDRGALGGQHLAVFL